MRLRHVLFSCMVFDALLLGALLFALAADASGATKGSGAPGPTRAAPDSCEPIWRPVDHPDIGPLNDVLAISSSDVYVGGLYGLAHWEGASWSTQLTRTVSAVAAPGPNDVWALSSQYILRWDGSSWSERFVWNSVLNSVAVGASDHAWVAGGHDFNAGSLDLFYWNGSYWTPVSVTGLDVGAPSGPSAPDGGGCEPFRILNDVIAVGTDEAWAVGYTGVNYPCSGYNPIMYHCVLNNCTSVTPVEANTALGSAGASHYWAVGGTHISHLVNGVWTDSPNPTSWQLTDVGGSSPNDVWAVGPSGFLHYDGSTWSVYPITSGARRLSAYSLTDAWAITGTTVLRYQPLQFVDVLPDNTFYPYVRCLSCRDIMSGYAVSPPCDPGMTPCFRPGYAVTRGQLAKIAANSAGFADPIPATQWTFQDVPPDSTFWVFVERLLLNRPGVMQGYPCGGVGEPCVGPEDRPYFRPAGTSTRGQLAKIVANTVPFNDVIPAEQQTFQDVPPDSTFRVYIERLLLNRPGVMNGYPCGGVGEPCVGPENRPYFRPGNLVTRGQTTKIISNTFFPDCTALPLR